MASSTQWQNPANVQDMMTMVIKKVLKKNKIMVVTDCINLARTGRA
jgi:hypothetical protein